MTRDHEIALARRDDIDAILDLQTGNLSSEGGGLLVPFSRDWFESAVADLTVIVARHKGKAVGYLVFSSFAAQSHVPVIQAMLRVYLGTSDAYLYGPICVAGSERGRGLAREMFTSLRARLPGREGITFIRRDNAVSLLAHMKMGMREVAEFTHGDIRFVIMNYIS